MAVCHPNVCVQLEDLELVNLENGCTAHLTKLSHLQKLTISVSCLESVDKFDLPLAHMTALRELVLAGAHYARTTAVDVSTIPLQLETLTLKMCRVSGLVNQTQLRVLVLQDVVLTAGEIIPDVEELHLGYVTSAVHYVDFLRGVPRPKLRCLDIKPLELLGDEEAEKVLLYLSEVPTLTSVRLHARLQPQHVRLVGLLPEACTLRVPNSELVPRARELHSATLPYDWE